MTKEQATKIMGKKKGGGFFGEATVNNPYKSGIVQGKGETFEVLYYYTDISSRFYKPNPTTINDDELTPLVFADGILIGWGRDFLEFQIRNEK